MSATLKPVTAANGYTTSYLPLTTAASIPVSQCLTAFWLSSRVSVTYSYYTTIYTIVTQLSGGIGSTAITSTKETYTYVNTTLNSYVALEPSYGLYADTNLKCLPQVVTSWWTRTATDRVILELGPIACPSGYSTVFSTSYSGSSSAYVGCCPTGYEFHGLYSTGTLGECASPLTKGQVLTYAYLDSISHATTATVVMTNTTSAYAVPIHGTAFQSSPTNTTSTTSNNGYPSAIVTNNNGSANAQHEAMTTGTKVAIGVGVSLGVLLIVVSALAIFCIRKYRRRRSPHYSSVQQIYPERDEK